jgi:hypothetical protein
MEPFRTASPYLEHLLSIRDNIEKYDDYIFEIGIN